MRERLPMSIRVLIGTGFLVAVGYGIVAPGLPTYAKSFGVGIAAASVVVSAFAVFRLAFAPASGRMINRLGELKVFCGGLGIVGVSSFLCAFASNFWQLLAFRAFGGIGSTMFTVAAAALLLRTAPPALRGRAAGAWATSFLLGSIAGPVIGGGLITFSPGAPFIVYAVVLGIAATVAGVKLHRPVGAHVEAEPSHTPTGTVESLRRHRTIHAALVANFLNGWTVYGVRVALVPLFIVDQLNRSSVWSGAALAAFAFGTVVTSWLGGWLSDLWGRRLPIVIGLIAVAIGMFGLGFSSSFKEVVFLAVLSGAGTGLVNPPTNAAVADVIAAHARAGRAGPALAIYQMVGDVGAIIGPVVAGIVVELWGYPSAFGLTAVIALVSIGGWIRARETAGDLRSRGQWRAGRRRSDRTPMTDAGTAPAWPAP